MCGNGLVPLEPLFISIYPSASCQLCPKLPQHCHIKLRVHRVWSLIFIFEPIWAYGHGRPQKIFQGGKVAILLIFFRLLAMQRKWTYRKKKMSNVTTTVANSVFLVRKLYTEQMFILVSMDILRLSWQSSK